MGRLPWSPAARVRVPTLVVWGDRDRLVSPRLAARTAAAIPGARLLMLPGVGHVAQIEAPETVARAVAGLWETARRSRAGETPPWSRAVGAPHPGEDADRSDVAPPENQ